MDFTFVIFMVWLHRNHPVFANNVDTVVRLCPYFAVEGKRIGLELLVRKTVLRKCFQTGGQITVFLDKAEVPQKRRDGWYLGAEPKPF